MMDGTVDIGQLIHEPTNREETEVINGVRIEYLLPIDDEPVVMTVTIDQGGWKHVNMRILNAIAEPDDMEALNVSALVRQREAVYRTLAATTPNKAVLDYRTVWGCCGATVWEKDDGTEPPHSSGCEWVKAVQWVEANPAPAEPG